NFPNRLVAGVMRLVIFPTGRHHHAPSDRLASFCATGWCGRY
ncbi:DUF1974 domain-containing protein, partial [Klebsiella pneumoniae]|nr:DUF1974 domain-containing protein [Klebsiella pneumoniae]